jgi:glycosyltransferase involved in cell wall biosynthesis
MTHPIQYYSPWFRFIAREADEIQLSVLYVTEPSSNQQGVGFGERFEWDVPLREGYESLVLQPSAETDRFGSDRFLGLDAPGIGRTLEGLKPDAVLVSGWHSLAQVRAILACRRRSVPLLYRGDTHFPRRKRALLWHHRTRFLLSFFDRFLYVGERVREHFERLDLPGGKLFRSPHAVDNEFFEKAATVFLEPGRRTHARREWGITAEEFVVLFAGKLESIKRPFDLIEAGRRLTDGTKILVVGAGPLREPCAELAARLRISVDFRGFLNQSELPRAYAISDALVLPSERESWGLAVNEAMACGLPAVVSDGVGCGPDLVSPGATGEIYPVGDTKALADRLERIFAEVRHGKRRGQRCRERVGAYSLKAATEGLVAACRSVMS